MPRVRGHRARRSWLRSTLSQRCKTGWVRTLYRNGRVYSPVDPFATALLVDGSTIAWLGSDAAASLLSADVSVDLDDSFVTPAFVDAHVHATGAGLVLTSLDLSATTSLGQALDLVERHSRASRGRPVLGGGWDEGNWPERRSPTRAELDRAGYGGVVYLARVDVHSAVVSSALAGSVAGLASLPGYSPDSLSLEAHHAVRSAAYSTLSPPQIRAAQRATRRRAAELGIGCLHEMAGPEVSSADDLSSLLALSQDEPGPDVIAYWGELFGIEQARELGAVGAGGDLFCDGSLGSHTAALTTPYADRATSGHLRFTTEQLCEHLLACAASGLQAGFHAIGDAAVTQILDAIDLASVKLGRLAGAGHRIEHAELVPDIARLARSGLTASVQPAFDATWGGTDGMYARRLGPTRAGGLNRFAALAAAGVPLALGSDAPVTPLDPWGAVRAAAYPHDPASAISPRSAFAAHTRGGWRAAGRTGDGVLSVGSAATFAVWRTGELGVDSPDDRVTRWSTDPRAAVPGLPDLAAAAELPRCVTTVVRGQTVYSAVSS
jgi:predicted amidohydrolase YtcJ